MGKIAPVLDPVQAPSKMTPLPEDSLRRSRLILWIGLAIYVLGVVWDGRWHSNNPQALEAGWALLRAHGLMYLGIAVVFAGSLEAFRAEDPPEIASWYGLVGLAALVYAIGSAWDAWAHAAGQEAGTAHLLSTLGLVTILASIIAASLTADQADAESEA